MTMPSYQSYPHQGRPPHQAPIGDVGAQKQKSRVAPIVLSGVIGLVLGIGGTLGAFSIVNIFTPDVGNHEAADSNSEAPEAQPAADDALSADESGPSDVEVVDYEPTVEDFDVKVSVKEQSCFGSAGCNVTLRTEPEYIGTEVPTGSWEITYEITGIENSPMIRSFDLDGDEFSFQSEASVGTTSSEHDINVEITDVTEGL